MLCCEFVGKHTLEDGVGSRGILTMVEGIEKAFVNRCLPLKMAGGMEKFPPRIPCNQERKFQYVIK